MHEERYREPRIERIDPSRYHELDVALGRGAEASRVERMVFDGALHSADLADVPPVRTATTADASRPTRLNGTGGTAMAWAGAVATILTLVAYAVGSFS